MPHAQAKLDAAPEIPDKLYFRIGEVSKLLGVEPYVLRYWEKEFPGLAPKKSGAGHRCFRRKDVELLLEIKQLLYEKRFTIEGARRYLGAAAKQAGRQRPAKPVRAEQGSLFGTTPSAWQDVRRELTAILEMLK